MTAPEAFFDGRVTLHCGDNRDVLRGIPDESVDSVVTDPPYALVSIVKRFGKPGSAPAKGDVYARAGAGFMGKQWDTGEVAFAVAFWSEILRVLKPGGHLVAFSGTRTYHRMVVAIEGAGFEIRDQLAWAYGGGFPKSHNLDGEWKGWGTALKPAWEPIVLARKPLVGTVAANVFALGTGALNIDACRVLTSDKLGGGSEKAETSAAFTNDGWRRPWMDDPDALERHAAKVRANVARSEMMGRWPANVIHDGSDEVVSAFPEAPGQRASVGPQHGVKASVNAFGHFGPRAHTVPRSDAGSAARFFYSAKADAEDRLGSKHPTVKPVDLMQWLVRLVTPRGGAVLDPFAGTGTTGEAAFREGCRAVLVEREPEYQADIRRRMGLCLAGPEERKRAITKAKAEKEGRSPDLGPLFGGEAAE